METPGVQHKPAERRLFGNKAEVDMGQILWGLSGDDKNYYINLRWNMVDGGLVICEA